MVKPSATVSSALNELGHLSGFNESRKVVRRFPSRIGVWRRVFALADDNGESLNEGLLYTSRSRPLNLVQQPESMMRLVHRLPPY